MSAVAEFGGLGGALNATNVSVGDAFGGGLNQAAWQGAPLALGGAVASSNALPQPRQNDFGAIGGANDSGEFNFSLRTEAQDEAAALAALRGDPQATVFANISGAPNATVDGDGFFTDLSSLYPTRGTNASGKNGPNTNVTGLSNFTAPAPPPAERPFSEFGYYAGAARDMTRGQPTDPEGGNMPFHMERLATSADSRRRNAAAEPARAAAEAARIEAARANSRALVRTDTAQTPSWMGPPPDPDARALEVFSEDWKKSWHSEHADLIQRYKMQGLKSDAIMWLTSYLIGLAVILKGADLVLKRGEKMTTKAEKTMANTVSRAWKAIKRVEGETGIRAMKAREALVESMQRQGPEAERIFEETLTAMHSERAAQDASFDRSVARYDAEQPARLAAATASIRRQNAEAEQRNALNAARETMPEMNIQRMLAQERGTPPSSRPLTALPERSFRAPEGLRTMVEAASGADSASGTESSALGGEGVAMFATLQRVGTNQIFLVMRGDDKCAVNFPVVDSTCDACSAFDCLWDALGECSQKPKHKGSKVVGKIGCTEVRHVKFAGKFESDGGFRCAAGFVLVPISGCGKPSYDDYFEDNFFTSCGSNVFEVLEFLYGEGKLLSRAKFPSLLPSNFQARPAGAAKKGKKKAKSKKKK